jgi:hypothetical protein
MPRSRLLLAYRAGPATDHHTFTGPLLLGVLAYGEFDPTFENRQILLATTQDGVSLAGQGPRLVVPGDTAGGRCVTGVVKVRLDKQRR